MSYLDGIEKLFDELPRSENEYYKILITVLKSLNGVINKDDDKLRSTLLEEKSKLIKLQQVFQFAIRMQNAKVTYVESEVKLRWKYKEYIWNEQEEAHLRSLRENPTTHTHERGVSGRERKVKDLKQRLTDLGYPLDIATKMAEDAV